MNLSSLFGVVASLVVFIVALVMSSKNYKVFIDAHALIVVIGGTVAATTICFPIKKVMKLIGVFIRRVLGKTRDNYPEIIDDVVLLAQAYKKGKTAFEAAIPKARDPFLRDAAQVLLWGDVNVPAERMQKMLELRAVTHFQSYMDEANIFRTMSKFPPAFGLMGTTLGMIALLQGLNSADAKNNIGPAMAIGLVATLYGIATTNFVLTPIAENLSKQTKEDLVARKMVIEGIMLIHEGMPVKFIEETVKSFLLPSERGDDKKKK